MFTRWTQHLKDQEDKQNFTNEIYSSRHVLEHLGTVLKSMELSREREELGAKVYDSPNWQFRQADCNGYIRCLREIQMFINLDQQKDSSK